MVYGTGCVAFVMFDSLLKWVVDLMVPRITKAITARCIQIGVKIMDVKLTASN